MRKIYLLFSLFFCPAIFAQTLPATLYFDYSSATTPFLSPPFISGTINDDADPAAATGFIVDIKDNGIIIPATGYAISVSSSNTAVVLPADVSITKSDGAALIKIKPAGTGYADLTFTL